jgi:signal transduction histidine kinase
VICAVTAHAHNALPGSIVGFNEPSFWQSYRWEIIGVISLCIVEAILIARLLVQRTYRMRVQEGFRESERALRESHSRITDLAGQLIEAQDQERQHIAREIHDDLTQRVAVISVGLSELKRRFPETDVAVRQRILLLQEEVNGLTEWIRRLSHELHSSTLDHLGLVAALRNYCQEFTGQHGIVVNLNITDALESIDSNVSLCVYRVVQEALHNIAKHAHVRDAEVKLTREHDGLSLTILDHGVGFDPKTAVAPGHGLGLMSMGERVKLLNGAFQINSAPGTGTEVKVWIPLRNNHAKSASVAGR